MRTNWRSAIRCDRLLLVPYRRDHVARYHEWMQCRQLLALTGSEPLTYREELVMQRSWRRDADKCTFIILERDVFENYPAVLTAIKDCDSKPPPTTDYSYNCRCRLCAGQSRPAPAPRYEAAETDSISDSSDSQSESECHCDDRELSAMIGDVNLFLSPSEGTQAAGASCAEIEVMIAEPWARGLGLGRVAVAALLLYAVDVLRVTRFVAKIGRGNTASRKLFASLGFEPISESSVFDQITMEVTVADDERIVDRVRENCPGYRLMSSDDPLITTR